MEEEDYPTFLSPSFQAQQKVNLLVSLSLFSEKTEFKLEYVILCLKEGNEQSAASMIINEFRINFLRDNFKHKSLTSNFFIRLGTNPNNAQIIEIIISLLIPTINKIKKMQKIVRKEEINEYQKTETSLQTLFNLVKYWNAQQKQNLFIKCIDYLFNVEQFENAFITCILFSYFENQLENPLVLWILTSRICLHCTNLFPSSFIYKQFLINECIPHVIKPGILYSPEQQLQNNIKSIFPKLMREMILYHFASNNIGWKLIFQILYDLTLGAPFYHQNCTILSIDSPHYLDIEKTCSFIQSIKVIRSSSNCSTFEKIIIDYILLILHCYFLNCYFENTVSREKSVFMVVDITSKSSSADQQVLKKQKISDDPFPMWSHSNHLNVNPKFSDLSRLLLVPYRCFSDHCKFGQKANDDSMIIEINNNDNNNDLDENEVKNLLQIIRDKKYQWIEFSTAEMNCYSGNYIQSYQQYQSILSDYNNNPSIFSQSFGNLYKYLLTLRLANCSLCLGYERQSILNLYSVLLSIPYPKREKNVIQIIQSTKDLTEQKSIEYFSITENTIGFQCILFLLKIYYGEEKYGDMIVLMQYGWPHFRSVFQNVIKSEILRNFSYPEFLNFIVNVDILEEFHYYLSKSSELGLEGSYFNILQLGQHYSIQTQRELLERHVCSLYSPEKSIDIVLTNFFRTQINLLQNMQS